MDYAIKNDFSNKEKDKINSYISIGSFIDEIIHKYNNTTIINNKYVLNTINNIIVIGDIHGDYNALLSALKLGNIIQDNINSLNNIDQINWIAKNTTVVQIGDLIDMKFRLEKKYNYDKAEKGDNLKIFSLLLNLQKQAKKKNSKLICLLGNHEIENVLGNFKYTSDNEFLEFYNLYSNIYPDIDKKNKIGFTARKTLFSRGNLIANLLSKNFNSIIVINNWLFVHGGINLDIIDNYTIIDMNIIFKNWLKSKTDKYDEDMDKLYFDKNSILKDRDLSKLKYNKKNYAYFLNLLDRLNIKNNTNIKGIIIGHTPQFLYNKGINSEFNNKLWKVDIGMSIAFGEIDNNDINRKIQILSIDKYDNFSIKL